MVARHVLAACLGGLAALALGSDYKIVLGVTLAYVLGLLGGSILTMRRAWR